MARRKDRDFQCCQSTVTKECLKTKERHTKRLGIGNQEEYLTQHEGDPGFNSQHQNKINNNNGKHWVFVLCDNSVLRVMQALPSLIDLY